jgi:hypothetical protein
MRSLGDPAELWRRDVLPSARPVVNAHVHVPPNFSAFDSVSQALDLAAAQGVRVVGVSNYYDYRVYDSFAALAQSAGVFPLFGLEVICLLDDLVRAGIKINDPGNPGKMYLCGKGISRLSPMSGAALSLLDTIRRSDSIRMTAVIEKLGGLFAAGGLETGLTEESIKAGLVRRYGVTLDAVILQERHVAQAFQEAVFACLPPERRADALRSVLGVDLGAQSDDAVRVQNAIRGQLMKAGKPGYVNETFVSFEHAYALVLALGGVPCYPVLADGATPICPFEEPIDRLMQALADRRIYCAELIPNRNRPEVLAAYARALRSAGIAVLAGTEHNTPEMLPLEPRCAGDAPIPGSVAGIFWEGACVVAAHQYLTANGLAGYVDETGAPSSTHGTGEARLVAFAKLGATVIEQYNRRTCAPL